MYPQVTIRCDPSGHDDKSTNYPGTQKAEVKDQQLV